MSASKKVTVNDRYGKRLCDAVSVEVYDEPIDIYEQRRPPKKVSGRLMFLAGDDCSDLAAWISEPSNGTASVDDLALELVFEDGESLWVNMVPPTETREVGGMQVVSSCFRWTARPHNATPS